MRSSCLLIFITAIVSRYCLAQAVIEGRVELPRARSAPVMNKRYEIVAKGGVLAPMPPLAVVYLEGSFAKQNVTATKQMAQKDLTFVPTLLPVQVGTRVEFPNLDDTYHNIFPFHRPSVSISAATAQTEVPIPSVLFDTPGLVTVRCDIHEHMRALILVLDTSLFRHK